MTKKINLLIYLQKNFFLLFLILFKCLYGMKMFIFIILKMCILESSYIYNILAFYYWIIIYFTIFIRKFSIKLKKIEIFNFFRYTFLKRRSN